MTATLPPPRDLERICKGLAALDAALCEEWQFRYYSFNAAWAAGERMASMRNGSGDDWHLVFAPGGAFLKFFCHEYKHADVKAIYAGLPSALTHFLAEPAFSMELVTYGGWHDGSSWILRGDLREPVEEELSRLSGAAEAYRSFAEEYFEREVPLDAIADALAGKKIDSTLLERLGSERTLQDMQADLVEIGYGQAGS